MELETALGGKKTIHLLIDRQYYSMADAQAPKVYASSSVALAQSVQVTCPVNQYRNMFSSPDAINGAIMQVKDVWTLVKGLLTDRENFVSLEQSSVGKWLAFCACGSKWRLHGACCRQHYSQWLLH